MTLLGIGASAQESDGWQIPHQARQIRVDGVLDEWDGVPALELQRPGQIAYVDGDPWRGVNDLSATIYVSHDATHLYVAGRILDDELVRERAGGDWFRGDAIELFLDTDPDAIAKEPPPHHFDRDDVQVFLMPLNPVRQWGVVTYHPEAQPGGAQWTWVQIAHVETEGKGYDFEAVLPLHNLPNLQPGTRRIGFNVAIDDCDGKSRYVYMTWTGTRPVNDTTQLVPVTLSGRVLEPEEPDSGGLYPPLRVLVPLLLAPLLLLVVGALLLHSQAWLSRQRPRWRLSSHVVAAALLLAGLLLPEWLARTHSARGEARLDGVVHTLQEHLPAMEAGTLGGYRGGERDRAFLGLLDGKPLPRKPVVTHRSLADLAPGGFGTGPQPFPGAGFSVRPYWIPLRPDRSDQIGFREPVIGRALRVVLGLPAVHQGDLRPAVQLNVQVTGDGPPREQSFDLDRQPKTSAAPFGHPDTDLVWVTLPIDEPVTAIGVRSTGDARLQLVGITVDTGADPHGRALSLGQASLGGVETDLRGPYPADAGVRLMPGARHRVELDPERTHGFDKLWLFYKADYPGTDRPLPFVGERVCEVVLHFAGEDPAPVQITLRHQESVFFERAGNNQDAEPRDPRASIAFRWEDENREQHVDLGYEVDLPTGAAVGAIEFVNLPGSVPIRFRSVVFRDATPTVRSEPPGSPLMPTAGGDEVDLEPAMREQLSPAAFAIYRSGNLQQSTRRDVPATLPRGMLPPPDAVRRRLVDVDETRSFEAYVPLGGDGWAGAVLGVFVRDTGWAAHLRWLHRLGFGLCLLAAPLLLVVFGDWVAVLRSLRLRLMAVLVVATLVPLGILSLVLVRVLESGHESRLRDSMEQAMASANGRLAEAEGELVGSARKWLDALAADVARGGVQVLTNAAGRSALQRRLRATMATQKPPDWSGGFLRLDFASDDLSLAVSAFVGDSTLQSPETPLRKEPAVYVSWGVPYLGVRLEQELPALGLCSLSVGRPLDRGLLGGLAPGRGVVLCDARGYALAAVDGRQVHEDLLLQTGRRPRLMAARQEAITAVLDAGQPVFVRHAEVGTPWIAVYDVLRDLDETPRALLGVVDLDQQATLPLGLGAVPVRTYFVAVGGIVLLLAGVLAFVVTDRISRPIERLERGARALGHGQLDVRVEVEEGGQIGRLTRTFNAMAEDLRGRIQDLHHLNRGIQELTARLDIDEIAGSAVAFCARHGPADRTFLLLRDAQRGRVELRGGSTLDEVDPDAADVRLVLTAVGPFSMELHGDRDPDRVLANRFSGHASAVVLPLLLAGRSRGALLLLFEPSQPDTINLELFSTMAAQAAVALENARLYRYAIEDPHTGAYVPDFFRRRVADEVQRARDRGEPLALLQLVVTDGGALHEAIGTERFEGVMERFTALLRRALPAGVMLCRAADDAMQVLLPAADRSAADAEAQRLRQALEHADLGVPDATGLSVKVAAAVYPSEAASAEFLLDAVQAQLSSTLHQPRFVETEGFEFTSAVMQDVLRTLERVAPTDLSVLFEGETGTGKEVLTDLLHRWSKRKDGPLVKVHCAALPESLLQSELFGHEKGAFTGAIGRRIGKFELAQGGTLFLDEVGEISLDTQVKLLRVLQEREVDRVGGMHPVPVDVRVVAATNRNLRVLVAEGRFREDLYYRLQGVVVTVPPLRERRAEIPALVERFRLEAMASGQSAVTGFDPDAMDVLFRQDWPGNVRELRNTVMRVLVLAPGDRVRREDLVAILPGMAASLRPSLLAQEPMVELPRLPPERSDSDAGASWPNLDGRLARLVELLRQRGSLSTPEYVDLVEVSHRTGLRDLTELVRLGVAERMGKRRGARYRLVPTRRSRISGQNR